MHAEKNRKELSAYGKFGVAYDYLAKRAGEFELEVDADHLCAKTQEARTKLEGMPWAISLDLKQVRSIIENEVFGILEK